MYDFFIIGADAAGLSAAVQIKRGPGRLSSWRSTQKDIEILEDLYDVENLEKPVLYFLEWVDHDLKNHEHDHELADHEYLKTLPTLQVGRAEIG